MNTTTSPTAPAPQPAAGAGPTATEVTGPPDALRPAVAVFTTLDTPDGPFSLLATADGVLASGWTADRAALAGLVHPGLRPGEDAVAVLPASDLRLRADRHPDPPSGPAPAAVDAVAVAAAAAAAVHAYYAGDLAAPGRIPVRQHSGRFRVQAWDTLRGVGPGECLTYAAYAARSGRPTAVRAAAAACALNAAALFVPCHRILRTDGTLGGFRYGLELKQRLLDREAGRPENMLF